MHEIVIAHDLVGVTHGGFRSREETEICPQGASEKGEASDLNGIIFKNVDAASVAFFFKSFSEAGQRVAIEFVVTDAGWTTATHGGKAPTVSRRELVGCIFWLCEGLAVGIPFLFAGGMINSDREVDLAGWLFVAGMVILPIISPLIWKHDRRLGIVGLLTFTAIGGLRLFLFGPFLFPQHLR
ncbi:MAG TPA: hypothetical protein VMZ30_12505 [Pyrinomonadaceae bacterium]|nr:hypothetical protein [Pyrinomonadaceae bacterium]